RARRAPPAPARGRLRAELARVPARGRGRGHGAAARRARSRLRPRLLDRARRARARGGPDDRPRQLAPLPRAPPPGRPAPPGDRPARAPLPGPPADVIYGRFVVTHLGDPQAAVDRWGEGVPAGARLLLEEVDTLDADDEALRRYYELVAALQAAHGQTTTVGR